MIDTHAHLDFPDFDQDREEVISRFFVTGGTAIINVGVDLVRSRKSIEISEKHEGVFASVGLHPDFFGKAENDLRFKIYDLRNNLKELARNKKVIAIGECGLDYLRIDKDDELKKKQKQGFLMQIEIAKELDFPVIVHCRNAWDDVYKIILNFKFKILNFVLHCYSGSIEDTEKFLKLPNVYFSFSGNITYPKPKEKYERLSEAIRMIPLDKIMLDSDAPYLAPQSQRGKRNEPIFIKYIAKKIAQIKGTSEKEVERKTDENAISFFRIEGN